ncbi:hypothetical protein ScPMuIL_002719 [Solemya velum]
MCLILKWITTGLPSHSGSRILLPSGLPDGHYRTTHGITTAHRPPQLHLQVLPMFRDQNEVARQMADLKWGEMERIKSWMPEDGCPGAWLFMDGVGWDTETWWWLMPYRIMNSPFPCFIWNPKWTGYQ